MGEYFTRRRPPQRHAPAHKLRKLDAFDSVDLLGISSPEQTQREAKGGEGEQAEPRLCYPPLQRGSVHLLQTHDDYDMGDRHRQAVTQEKQRISQGLRLRRHRTKMRKTVNARPRTRGGPGTPNQKGNPSTAINAQRKFRRREGHGPVRMARKKIWEDWWENWKSAKQQEMREQKSRGREDPAEKARREEEWHKQVARHFHGDRRGQGSYTTSSSQAKETTWLRDVHGQWVEVVIAAGPSRERSHQQNHHHEIQE